MGKCKVIATKFMFHINIHAPQEMKRCISEYSHGESKPVGDFAAILGPSKSCGRVDITPLQQIFDHCKMFSTPAEWRMIWLSLECASLRMAQRKWNGSGEMREVNEMYLRLNTLRDRSGIGPLIKNHSEGEVMQRDRVRSKDSFDTLTYSRCGSSQPSESI